MRIFSSSLICDAEIFYFIFLVLAYDGIADQSSEYWISVPSLDCLERRSAERFVIKKHRG